MSEIKGQLLCILLVLAVFSLIAGTMYASFDKAKEAIVSKVDAELVISASSSNSLQ